jgi:hypothetical protein
MRYILTILLLLFPVPFIHAEGFDLSLECEGGYQTNVYDASDMKYKNSPLLTYLVNPEYSRYVSEMWLCKTDAGVAQDIFPGTNDNLSVESGIDFSRQWQRNRALFGLSGGYYSQPGILDPDQPLKNMMYNLSAEYKHGFRFPVKAVYSMLVMDEIKSTRLDYKNKINVKIYFDPVSWIRTAPGAGAAWNHSNYKAYNYGEITLSLSNSLILKEKNLIMAMLFVTPRFYKDHSKDQTEPVGGAKITAPQKPTKNNNLTACYSYIALSYFREISKYIDLQVNYTNIFYDSDANERYHTSHRISAGFAYRFMPL